MHLISRLITVGEGKPAAEEDEALGKGNNRQGRSHLSKFGVSILPSFPFPGPTPRSQLGGLGSA